MKSVDDKVSEEVLACSNDIQRLVAFFEKYQSISRDLTPIYLDYMRIYKNVMEKNPDKDMTWRKNQTYIQLTNLYETKVTQKQIMEAKK